MRRVKMFDGCFSGEVSHDSRSDPLGCFGSELQLMVASKFKTAVKSTNAFSY